MNYYKAFTFLQFSHFPQHSSNSSYPRKNPQLLVHHSLYSTKAYTIYKHKAYKGEKETYSRTINYIYSLFCVYMKIKWLYGVKPRMFVRAYWSRINVNELIFFSSISPIYFHTIIYSCLYTFIMQTTWIKIIFLIFATLFSLVSLRWVWVELFMLIFRFHKANPYKNCTTRNLCTPIINNIHWYSLYSQFESSICKQFLIHFHFIQS